MDQQTNFNLIRIKKRKKEKNIFQIHYGFFEYLVMLFNLINVSATKQKFMNDMFQDIFNDYIIFYLDNTLMYSSEIFKNYIQKIKKILN